MFVKLVLSLASAFGALAVILGAFGAHALKGHLSDTALNTFDTAVKYQSIHALALLFVGLITLQHEQSLFRWSATFFICGVLLFSGSLYMLAFGAPRWVGPITPVGGLCLIVGWMLLLIGALKLDI